MGRESNFVLYKPNIYENSYLREPQILAYDKVYKHFITNCKKTHAIVVLPTGVGKTGLIGLLPYGISKKRVLIITPQLTIKDAVLDSLDPMQVNNFWLKRNVFSEIRELPSVTEYEGKQTNINALEMADIVILNIHKLQARLESSLLNVLPEDFFDMIIIDEAHHSTANTWKDALDHFFDAKVVKLTGTPFRTDEQPLIGEEVYKYKLSQAMAKGFVKSLSNYDYIPETLYLTIDKNDNKKYTLEEIQILLDKDETWISRSVAYSNECSMKIVEKSIEIYNSKVQNNNIPHKIIAVACSIYHAEQVKKLYESRELKVAIIHSELEDKVRKKVFSDIENHRIQVLVNVAMLGEGYDHCYFSVAAIFRPYRSLLPYAQFIGRILRIIETTDEYKPTARDNIGEVVSHNNLYLNKLWDKYKKEIKESEIIKELESTDFSFWEDNLKDRNTTNTHDDSIGFATEEGQGKVMAESFLDTELIKKREGELKEENRKISALKELLNINEVEARRLYLINKSSNEIELKRPDLFFKRNNKSIDVRIKEEMVPDLISKYKLNKDDDNISDSIIFRNSKYNWIAKKIRKNAGMLAVYLSNALNDKIGKKKELWNEEDLKRAPTLLEEIYVHLDKVLDSYLNI